MAAPAQPSPSPRALTRIRRQVRPAGSGNPRAQSPSRDSACPSQPRRAAADSVIRHTSRWMLRTGIAAGEEVRQLRCAGVMDAGPQLVPAAAADVACLVSDWTVFLTVLGDQFGDGSEPATRPDLAEAAIRPILAALRGQDDRSLRIPGLAGLGTAAADLGHRFKTIAPSLGWLRRLQRHAEDHLQSKVTGGRRVPDTRSSSAATNRAGARCTRSRPSARLVETGSRNSGPVADAGISSSSGRAAGGNPAAPPRRQRASARSCLCSAASANPSSTNGAG